MFEKKGEKPLRNAPPTQVQRKAKPLEEMEIRGPTRPRSSSLNNFWWIQFVYVYVLF